MILGLPVIFSRVLMPSLPHFQFLQDENTDKVQKNQHEVHFISQTETQHQWNLRVCFTMYPLDTSCEYIGGGWGTDITSSILLDLNGFLCLSQRFFRTDVIGPYLNHRVLVFQGNKVPWVIYTRHSTILNSRICFFV